MRCLCSLIVLLITGRSVAQTSDAMRLFLSPSLGHQRVSTAYSFDYSFQEDASDDNGDMSFAQHDFRLRLPLSQDEQHEWTLGTGLTALDFDTNVVFPDTSLLWHQEAFPDELWDLRLDTTYRWRLDNDWTAGGQLAVNSPSDRPFASLDEVAVVFNGFLRIPQGESDAWLLFLNYSSNREFLQNIPIPGIGYQLERENVSILLGAPLATVHAEPFEWLHLDATYFVPRTVRTEISVLPIEPLRLYGSYNWANDRYLRHNRRDDDDRLFYYEQNVKAGIEWRITETISVDAHGGYAFNRFFFEGEKYDDRDHNRINIDDGPFVGARVVVRF